MTGAAGEAFCDGGLLRMGAAVECSGSRRRSVSADVLPASVQAWCRLSAVERDDDGADACAAREARDGVNGEMGTLMGSWSAALVGFDGVGGGFGWWQLVAVGAAALELVLVLVLRFQLQVSALAARVVEPAPDETAGCAGWGPWGSERGGFWA